MTNSEAPAGNGEATLSVVIVTPDTFQTIRRTVEHLRAQTIVGRLELVIVAPAESLLEADAALLDGFHAVRVAEIGPIGSVGPALAAGIRTASAPIVALAEDHCFPDPDWAESLERAHAGPWTAVGPAVRNANPATTISWADLFIAYGPWLEPAAGGEVPLLPGHNTSYKRAVLLSLGDRLEELMEAETLLHWELRAAGHRLLHEPKARVRHTNFSRLQSWIPTHFLGGRLFASARREGMSAARRLVYIAGSPAIPLVRLARLARVVPPALRGRFVRALPAIVGGLLLDGAGQMVGYAMGIGDGGAGAVCYEFRRVDHITPADRAAVFGP